MTATMITWDALRNAIVGDVILPDSPAYDTARKPAIARFDDVRPRAVVRCETATDVAATISLARTTGLPTAARSGGHCFAGRSSTTGIVIDVSPMRAVSLANGVVTVGAGARLGDLYDTLDAHGLTIPAGCGPSVGIAGLTLGGGLGILGRKHGLTSDHLLGAQVVLADGRVVDCDDRRHPDLFWALRGAGNGNFGVVTSLVFDTLPAPPATSFHLVWPWASAAAMIAAWQSWAPAAPNELAASLVLTAAGDVDQSPVVTLFGAMLGPEADTERLLDTLVARVGAEPDSASFGYRSYRETKRYLADHGPGEEVPAQAADQPASQGHPYSKSEFFQQTLPPAAIAALVAQFSQCRVAGQSRVLDFMPWGGAYNRVRPDATAFVHRDERFLLKHEVVVDASASAAERDCAQHWLDQSWTTVHPWGSGGAYPNFPDPDLADWADAYYGTNLVRLAQIKRRYDPDDVFHFHQSLPLQVPNRGALVT